MKKKPLLLISCLVFCMAFCCVSAAETVLDDDFSTNIAGEGVPAGWDLYRQGPTLGKIIIRENGSGKELYMKDVCNKSEIGISRIISAVPGKYYRLTAEASAIGGNYGKNAPSLQLRFLSKPNQVNNTWMVSGKPTVVTGKANADKMRIYIFTLKYGQPELTVSRIKLEVSDTPF